MIRCTQCLIPDTRPDTAFINGVCSACVNFAKRPTIDWDERAERLEAVLEDGKNSSGFDCIVPSSGGKDSHYQVLTLLAMGARPLVVTASTCYLTPIGRRNIDNLARYATTIEVTPNRDVRRKLNKFGLVMVGDISYPEHLAIFSIPFQIATKLGIPLIFYGESPQREYGCPDGAEEAMTMSRRWVHEFGGLLGMRANDAIDYEGITAADMSDYLLPSDDEMKRVGVVAHFLGQYLTWDSHDNARIAREAGMDQVLPCEANWWPHENLDNAMTGIHDHQMFRKYGYGRMAAQMSVDIRHGITSRGNALEWVRQLDGTYPRNYAGVNIKDIIAHLNMTEREFANALDSFTNWDLFESFKIDRPVLKEECHAVPN